MKTPNEQIKELQAMIEQSKNQDDILVKNWQRSIKLLKQQENEKSNNVLVFPYTI